jgi:hypothetical protein
VEPGKKKIPKNVKSEEKSCLEVLDVLFGGAGCGPCGLKALFVGLRIKVLHFDHFFQLYRIISGFIHQKSGSGFSVLTLTRNTALLIKGKKTGLTPRWELANTVLLLLFV